MAGLIYRSSKAKSLGLRTLESVHPKLQLLPQLRCSKPPPIFIQQKLDNSAALLRMASTQLSFDTGPGSPRKQANKGIVAG